MRNKIKILKFPAEFIITRDFQEFIRHTQSMKYRNVCSDRYGW